MKLIAAAASAAILFALQTASAEDKPATSAPAAMPADEPHGPGLGEIMSLQQMRHIKLWFAGHARNWPLADYEVDRLKGGFEDVSRLLGGDTVDKAVGGAIAALEKAVEAKDLPAFTRAYDQLSAGCNNCHQTLDHAYIRIQRPSVFPYSDQAVAPEK